MANGKTFNRFANDFVNSRRFIGCERAICRNCHEMNIHIVKGLFDDCPALAKSFFEASSFSFEASVELKRLYDTANFTAPNILSSNAHKGCSPLSFGCAFTHNQLERIADCANRYALFCPEIAADDMDALFCCQSGFYLRVNNIRRVAILFDALHRRNFIRWNWQTVLSKRKLLLKKDGSKFLNTSNLSTAVSDTRGSDDPIAFGIRRAVAGLKE